MENQKMIDKLNKENLSLNKKYKEVNEAHEAFKEDYVEMTEQMIKLTHRIDGFQKRETELLEDNAKYYSLLEISNMSLQEAYRCANQLRAKLRNNHYAIIVLSIALVITLAISILK